LSGICPAFVRHSPGRLHPRSAREGNTRSARAETSPAARLADRSALEGSLLGHPPSLVNSKPRTIRGINRQQVDSSAWQLALEERKSSGRHPRTDAEAVETPRRPVQRHLEKPHGCLTLAGRTSSDRICKVTGVLGLGVTQRETEAKWLIPCEVWQIVCIPIASRAPAMADDGVPRFTGV
jgi:hypothetical protein